MIKILIADDHEVVRQGLKQILEGAPDLVVEGEAANGREVLDKVRSSHWDVVVLDITMPCGDGMETLKELKRARLRLPVLILSIHAEDQFGVRALSAGASGYMTKECAADELVSAIRKVCAGEKYISSRLAEEMAFDLERGTEKSPRKKLSDREFQVMCMIASGKTVKETADELLLSTRTISTYRARVLDKMRMKTNAELTRYAITNHLMD